VDFDDFSRSHGGPYEQQEKESHMARRYPIVWGALFAMALPRFADRSCDPDRRGRPGDAQRQAAAAIAASDISSIRRMWRLRRR